MTGSAKIDLYSHETPLRAAKRNARASEVDI